MLDLNVPMAKERRSSPSALELKCNPIVHEKVEFTILIEAKTILTHRGRHTTFD
jgi:hypothetical protein